MRERFRNASSTTLAAAVTDPGATTITVASASVLPTSPQFRILIDSECMLVTGIVGNVLTVQRGVEGTTASTHSVAVAVTHILTVASLTGLGADNDAYFNGVRPTFELLAADGSTLTASSFTAHNDSGDAHAAVVTNSDRRVTIKRPAGSGNGSNESLTLLSRPAPSTPYTVTLSVQPNVVASSYQFAVAVGFREASTGESLIVRIPLFTGSPPQMFVNTATNEASIALVAGGWYYCDSRVLWFQLSDDGTTLSFAYSTNGVDFVPFYTAARSTYFTSAPEPCWGCGAHANSADAYLSLLSWSE